MSQLWEKRIVRIWVKTFLLFFLTCVYMFLLRLFFSAIALPKLVSFLIVSAWYIIIIFMIEYYIETSGINHRRRLVIEEEYIAEEEDSDGNGDVDILFKGDSGE